ncbi:carbohydrate ABC transporter permease [Treponema porcinum]|uniref:carbohydrate ABC transporter permease n=1 Tax=Treponema porcinum TaxID=261392 RepID=UPI003F024F5D
MTNAMAHTRNSQIAQILKYILLILATAVVVFPILVIFLGSFKTGEEFNRSGPFDLPKLRSNEEIWKGAQELSADAGIMLSAQELNGHQLKKLTFVFDEIKDYDSAVVVRNKNGEISAFEKLNLGTVEAVVEIPADQEKVLLEGGVTVTGTNCKIRKIKTEEKFLFGNYITAFTKGKMLLGFMNTLIIIVFSGIGTVLTGAMTAYILHRFQFRMKKLVYTMFMWIALIPTITAQVATFQIIQKLGMYNTRLSVIILSMGTDIISIMIYIQFLNSISVSLDESAIMDGANYWQVFTKIIMPLLQPATVTILILKCVNLYNDFYNPLLYMPKNSLMVISTSLYKFKGPFGTNWPVICAGVIIAVIPTLIIFLCMQKYIYSGMVSGSVKE